MTRAPDPAEVRALREALEAVAGAMMHGGDGAVGDFGWNISALNKARPLIRDALASATGAPPVAAMGERPRRLTMPNGEIIECDYPDSPIWARSWSIRYPDTGQIGTTGEQDWELVERYGLTAILEAALTKPTPPASVSGEVLDALERVRDALLDSQYLAGVTAGWNAAQSDEPEAALARLQAARAGHLADFKEAKATLAAAPEAATPSAAGGLAAEFVAALTSNGTNRAGVLSINHDELSALVKRALAANEAPSAVGGVDRMREALRRALLAADNLHSELQGTQP